MKFLRFSTAEILKNEFGNTITRGRNKNHSFRRHSIGDRTVTKTDVINNIMANYQQYGIDQEWLEKSIKSGEEQGFSYQTIYTGLRMALGSATGQEELFTVAEMAEALGEPEGEIIRQIEELTGELQEAGEDTEQYFRRYDTAEIQCFMIPAGGLKS